MEQKCHIWLINGEDLLKFDWAKPQFLAEIGEELSSYYPKQGYIHVSTQTVEIPNLNPELIRVKTVEGLREQIKTVRAEAEKATIQINERINDLLMIGYSAGPKIDDDIPF